MNKINKVAPFIIVDSKTGNEVQLTKEQFIKVKRRIHELKKRKK